MVIFHSYVSLPEGNHWDALRDHEKPGVPPIHLGKSWKILWFPGPRLGAMGGPGESPESTGSTGADADQELRGFMQLRPFITYNWL